MEQLKHLAVTAILKKEIQSFFASPIGYLVLGLFLIGNGLFLWIFEGGYNVLDSGFASLSPFFDLAPWIFLLLLPAVTMKSFSEEIRQGTLELLLTKPLSCWEIVLGKYLGALCLVILALIPTLLYVLSLYYLAQDVALIETGVIIGSYMGLLLLGGCYAAVGTFASVLSPNQIVSFILAVLLCFLFYFGFEAVAALVPGANFDLDELGISAHYRSISRGVIDTRDLVYFLSFISFFLYLTQFILKGKK